MSPLQERAWRKVDLAFLALKALAKATSPRAEALDALGYLDDARDLRERIEAEEERRPESLALELLAEVVEILRGMDQRGAQLAERVLGEQLSPEARAEAEGLVDELEARGWDEDAAVGVYPAHGVCE